MGNLHEENTDRISCIRRLSVKSYYSRSHCLSVCSSKECS